MITQFLNAVDAFIWGIPLLILIMGTGLLLTIRLKGMQFSKLGRALKYMVRNEEGASGEVSSFGALCTALSATIGTGNIVGVSTALMVGGPGALFWMFIAACVGLATKFSEGCLAVMYRHKNPEGGFLGGPFCYIEDGIKERYGWNARWLGKLFALFGCIAGAFGIGTITQINGIASAAEIFFTAPTLFTIGEDKNITIVTILVAIIVTVCAALVIIGGIKRIASVTTVIVPFMAVAYVLISLIIIFRNITAVPQAIADIVTMAFGAKAAAGGAFGAFYLAITKGVARGVFSNESGLGSAPIAAAAAQTNQPVRQGLVSMTGTFIDTICICMMTGLVIMTSGAYEYCLNIPELSEGGSGVTIAAFSQLLGDTAGSFVVMCSLAFFAFTTILGWDYYAERCCEYLFNGSRTAVQIYRWLYVFAVFIGPFLTLSQVWTIANIFNAMMAAPNLIGLLLLNGVVARAVKKYFNDLETGGYKDGYAKLPLGCHKK